MSRTRLAHLSAAATAAILVLVLTSCSGGSTATPSEANLSGSSISAADDVSALCAQVVEQKLPAEAAQALAESSGYVARIDGASAGASDSAATPSAAVGDLVVLTVTGDIVTACELG